MMYSRFHYCVLFDFIMGTPQGEEYSALAYTDFGARSMEINPMFTSYCMLFRIASSSSPSSVLHLVHTSK